jgi:hypothetical protein
MLGLMLRGFFLMGIISWYSNGVFRMINEYFHAEYKHYLTEEVKKNKYLMQRPEDLAKLKDPSVATVAPKNFDLPHDTTIIEKSNDENENECVADDLKSKTINTKELVLESDNDIEYRHLDADDAIVNYWIDHKRKSHSHNGENDALCQVENVKKCKDN